MIKVASQIMSAKMDFLVNSTGPPLSSQVLVLQRQEDQKKSSTKLGKEARLAGSVPPLSARMGDNVLCQIPAPASHRVSEGGLRAEFNGCQTCKH